jgi:hypothetical protein
VDTQDPNGQVYLATGKTTMAGYRVNGWTSQGVRTTAVEFVGGPTVRLEKGMIADPPGIASQIRGFAPLYANLTVSKAAASAPPAMDGSLTGWESATVATFPVDGLNVNGPADIKARLLYDASTIYIHWSVNQTATGWPIALEDLEPANRMFTHGRGATTCSMYAFWN